MALTAGEERALADTTKNTLLSVWLTPTSTVALCAIRLMSGLSGTDAVNQAIQAYALKLEAEQ